MRESNLDRLQSVGAQLEQLQQFMQSLQEQSEQLQEALSCVEQLRECKNNDDILVPLVSGIFLKASLADVSSALVNIGAGVIVSKPLDHVEELLQAQRNELAGIEVELSTRFSQLYREFISLQTG